MTRTTTSRIARFGLRRVSAASLRMFLPSASLEAGAVIPKDE